LIFVPGLGFGDFDGVDIILFFNVGLGMEWSMDEY
jgi:hypothetical protein